MSKGLLIVSLLKGGLVYKAKFKLGGFLVTSVGLTLYGVDINITDFLPVTETVTDIIRNPNSLPNTTLSIRRDIFSSLPGHTVTPSTLPRDVNTKF